MRRSASMSDCMLCLDTNSEFCGHQVLSTRYSGDGGA